MASASSVARLVFPPPARSAGSPRRAARISAPARSPVCRVGLFEPGAKRFELLIGVLELTVDQPRAFGGELDMGDRRLGRAGGDLQRLLAQDAQGLGGADPADAMSLQDFGEAGLVDPGGLGGGGCAIPTAPGSSRPSGRRPPAASAGSSATIAGESGWPGGCAPGSGRRRCATIRAVRSTVGSSTANRRKARRSVRRLSPITCASRRRPWRRPR